MLWPSWIWTWRPEWRGLFSSYAQSLAVRDSVRTRTIVESAWYRERFSTDPLRGGKERWRLKDDQNAKDFFENTASGFRISLGVGGKGTGYRGNCVLVDDPMNASDAPSKAARDSVIFWWDQQMSNRVNDASKDSFVIIQQRLHEEDLAGHALGQGGYEHLCLPSEFDPKRISITSLGKADPRTVEGELLFPALFPKPVLDEAKVRLGSDGYAGQHDQLPHPAGGGLFKRAWWRFWRFDSDQPTTAERPRGCSELPTRVITAGGWKWDTVLLSADCTFKGVMEAKGKDPDYVVITVWGTKGADRFVLYRYRKQVGIKDTIDAMRAACKIYPKCYRKLVEDKANGSAVIELLKSEISGIVAVEPEGGKEARANACAPQIESGNVYLPEGAPWLEEWIGEFAGFPKAKHDDQVDSATQALIALMPTEGAARLRMMVQNT